MIIRRCVPEGEQSKILQECHASPYEFRNIERIERIAEGITKKQQTHEKESSAEGLTLKELPNLLKYEFLEPEKKKISYHISCID